MIKGKMNLLDEKNQIISKERVLNHGEVYTADREVNAMLDLVKHETERIESRFLEPACGSGNFLREVLKRKLDIVEDRYKKNQIEFERYAILAVSSIYGIDILEDNVVICRDRLYKIFLDRYKTIFKEAIKEECLQASRYIIEKNIIHGDALTLKTVGSDSKPIVFPEWSPVNGNMMKRRDFTFHELLSPAGMRDLPLFSDMGDNVFISTPVKEYPVVNFLKVLDVDSK
jgi:hypothetical protein